MRYQVEAKGEYTYLLGEFATGETVTIVVYNILTGVVVPLDSSSCAEIATLGWFRWNTQNITTPVTLKTDYLYIMTDSNGLTYSGKFIVGGYVDLIDTPLSEIDDNLGSISEDTDELQTNQGNWLTATGFNTVVPDNEGIAENGASIGHLNNFDPRRDTVITDTGSRLASKANVSGLSTFQPDSDVVITDDASREASRATGFSIPGEYDLDLNTIRVDVAGLNGEAMRGTDGANKTTPDNAGITANGVLIVNLKDFDHSTEAVITDSASREASKATGFSTLNPPSQNLNDYKADVSAIDTMLIDVVKLTGNKVTKSGDIITIFESNGTTVWRQYDLADGGRVVV